MRTQSIEINLTEEKRKTLKKGNKARHQIEAIIHKAEAEVNSKY